MGTILVIKGCDFSQNSVEKVNILRGYGTIVFNGSEDWLFNEYGEPNDYGYYNCYMMNPNVVNPAVVDPIREYFEEAYCDNPYFNRNITTEMRDETNTGGFGFRNVEPSFYFRFDSSIATSVETFKAYLRAHPITVTYKQI